MSSFRKRALEEFVSHKAERFFQEDVPVSDYFGKNVFDLKKMQKYLSQDVYSAVLEFVNEGVKIDRNIANQVALGMKDWAVEQGVTHYTHWFHPLTDSTAEKHEAFVDPTEDGHVFENFKGDALIQQEPDASSFPNGGLRNTFEARGYTAWDPTSPAFIMDQTLCIPTVFVSYTGEALDMKIPHLKSLGAVDKAVVDVMKLFGKEIKGTNVMLGIEQEYFLVDDSLFRARPDLQICNRTVIGHTAAKDQQLEDHYFGAIPSRVMDFMKDFETEAFKLGILLKTRHNEVAPNQFECAPYFSEANLAIDHNLMLMILMRKIAKRHHLKVIFHEKPFMGVNGSGKHANWSVRTSDGEYLLSPGKSPGSNLQFLCFLTSIIRAMHEHGFLMMSGIATLNNQYRLGGGEAPPAIMSVFIGSTLDKILNAIENADNSGLGDVTKPSLDVIQKIPEILSDNTDRNRTSPFAFTGNRFEFRAVGSSVNVAFAMSILNTAIAQQLIRFKENVERLKKEGDTQQEAILKTIRLFIVESKDIRFEGNGYSEQWYKEATRRGLSALGNVPESYKVFLEKKTVALFTEQSVLTQREVEARYEVMNEIYWKKLQIESRVLGDLIINHIIPTAIKFQNTLIENVRGLKDLFGEDKYLSMCGQQMKMIEKISYYIDDLRTNVREMIHQRKRLNAVESVSERACQYAEFVYPYFDKIRDKADKLEMVVDDELWPLPKYRELLLLR